MHPACYQPTTNTKHRKTHRRRFSAPRLSSETIQTLPEYSSPPSWSSAYGPLPPSEAEFDRPPDYPETTDETDVDSDDGLEERICVQHDVVHPPRRLPTRTRRRKRVLATTSDPLLDTLLERSVHALEMSNVLLRTTVSAQSSISALLSSEDEPDRFLEVRARNLSTRICATNGVHETWMECLEEISEGVDKLFSEEGGDEGTLSRSLPTTSMPDLRHRRKPSILELNGSSNSHLRYSRPTREVLVAPAPRALTQYVESTADPHLITLPSTLGLRTSTSSHSVQTEESSCGHRREQRTATNMFSETRPECPTSAYHLLSNLVKRSESLTPPPSSRLPKDSAPAQVSNSPNPSRSGTQQTMRYLSSNSPTRLCAMFADDDLSHSSSESSDHPTGYRTVQSLRKILDDHPSSTSINTLRRRGPKLHAPVFLPITPPPVPVQGTSAATASISRLYTKGRHSMSTRPPSPPTHSSLKARSTPATPSPSPSTMSLTEVFRNSVAKVMGSAPPSGVSTPKRISFAELPESYSSSQPGTSKLRDRKSKKKGKQGNGGEEVGSWLKVLLRGALTSGGLATAGSREERIEERMARGRPGYGALDDWAV